MLVDGFLRHKCLFCALLHVELFLALRAGSKDNFLGAHCSDETLRTSLPF